MKLRIESNGLVFIVLGMLEKIEFLVVTLHERRPSFVHGMVTFDHARRSVGVVMKYLMCCVNQRVYRYCAAIFEKELDCFCYLLTGGIKLRYFADRWIHVVIGLRCQTFDLSGRRQGVSAVTMKMYAAYH